MTHDNEAIVRRAYHTAEGNVLDVAGFVGSFAEDGVFNDVVGQASYRGKQLGERASPADPGTCPESTARRRQRRRAR